MSVNIFEQFPFPVMSFASIVGILLAIFSAAKLADDAFGTGPTAKKFGKFFRNSVGVRNFGRAYVGASFLMDQIYGERILSLRSLFVSFLSTLIWIGGLVVAMIVTQGKSAWVFDYGFSRQVAVNFWWFAVVGLVVDYFSASIARLALRQSLDFQLMGKLVWLAAAAMGNAFIFFVLYNGVKNIYLGQPMGGFLEQLSIWMNNGLNLHLTFETLSDWKLTEVAPGVFDIKDGNSEVVYAFPEGMLFFSSQLTLIWFLLQILAHRVYFGGYRVAGFMKRLIAESSLESKPLQSAATILGILVLLPLWIIAQIWHYAPILWRHF